MPAVIILYDHHLIKGSRILILEKLTSKELSQILISSRTNKITSATYFETMFNTNDLDWTKIFILPCMATYNVYLCSFQYAGSYCNTYDETPIHLFCECNSTKNLWLQLNRHFCCYLTFPALTPQTALLGLFNDSVSSVRLINHILLLFKLYIYKSRKKHRLNINELSANILKIKELGKVAGSNNV